MSAPAPGEDPLFDAFIAGVSNTLQAKMGLASRHSYQRVRPTCAESEARWKMVDAALERFLETGDMWGLQDLREALGVAKVGDEKARVALREAWIEDLKNFVPELREPGV